MSIPSTLNLLPKHRLFQIGLKNAGNIHYQTGPDDLAEAALRRNEAQVSDTGALVISTGKFTGRSPKDKFIVKDSLTEQSIHWNEFNTPISEKYFDTIFSKVMGHLNAKHDLWVRDCFACADEDHRISIRVINEKPANNLFAYNMFIRPSEEELDQFNPQWHVFSAPELKLDPEECGTRTENAAVISFRHRMILIVGTGYTGEMKKGIFTILNYILTH
jgi:phosphoenolpyruvate carboxykinase (ATP)